MNMKGSKFIIIVSIFLIFSKYGESKQPASCSTRKPLRNTTPTNFTVYEKTFSLIAGGEKLPIYLNTTEDFHEFLKQGKIISRSDIIAFGKVFITNMKETYGVDVSGLTDTQLYLGETGDIGGFTFYGGAADNDARVITETTSTLVKYYRNSRFQMGGYILRSKKSMTLSGGKWEGTIPKGANLWLALMVLDVDKECGFSKEPEVFTIYQIFPYIVKDNISALMWTVYSDKYGWGKLHGLSVFLDTYTLAAIIRFPM
ncbi:unnamed protein product [Owenia fusiformis]|uniref:Uncharacterized protein n=1 Tax=Owenia fusiformis TaxID=6347 RepID=A0A8J1XGM6_OWEFU|nr:unnamed protein product [Owenia fusiformis]